MTARFSYLRAPDWPAALRAVADGAVPQGGGVDLLDRLKEHLDAPARIVSLLSIPGAADVARQADGTLRIGPLCALVDVAENAYIIKSYPALASAAGTLATPAIRNAATLAGNLAQRPRCAYFRSAAHACLRKGGASCLARTGDHRLHAIFDTGPCVAVHASSLAASLVAYQAKVTVVAQGHAARTVALETLFMPASEDPTRELRLGPGELITAVELPPPRPNTRSAYAKVRPRESFDWPLVEAAVALVMEGPRVIDARVVLGAVAMTPWRASASEAALRAGARLDDALIARASERAIEGATPLPDNRYKLKITRAVVARALTQARDAEA